MAKAAAKTSTSKESKKPSAGTKISPNKLTSSNLEKVSTEVLEKLQTLGIDDQLQRDIKWCLGSYMSDQNPSGLYDTAKKALMVFQIEKEKKTKGVTAKLIQDLEKIVKEQEG